MSKPDICAKGFELFVRQAREAQIISDFPKFGLGIFKKAMAAGYGEEAGGRHHIYLWLSRRFGGARANSGDDPFVAGDGKATSFHSLCDGLTSQIGAYGFEAVGGAGGGAHERTSTLTP